MLLFIALTFFVPSLYEWFFPEPVPDLRMMYTELAALDTASGGTVTGHPENNATGYTQHKFSNFKRAITAFQPLDLFRFDPNSVSAEGWQKLGVKDKTIQTILKYRAKGGRFRHPEDIRKIWGIAPDLANRLIPYISIQEEPLKENTSGSYKKIEKAIIAVDINLADSAGFASLPGIGERLSARIVLFRNKLGGFYSADQLKEVFGLQDSVFQKIKAYVSLNNAAIRHLNINTADQEALQSHPYIRYQLANALIRYRTQHGRFTSIEDVKKIMLVNEDLYNKLAPYLVVE